MIALSGIQLYFSTSLSLFSWIACLLFYNPLLSSSWSIRHALVAWERLHRKINENNWKKKERKYLTYSWVFIYFTGSLGFGNWVGQSKISRVGENSQFWRSYRPQFLHFSGKLSSLKRPFSEWKQSPSDHLGLFLLIKAKWWQMAISPQPFVLSLFES